MKKVIYLILLFLSTNVTLGQDLAGDWKGYIDLESNKLIIKTHFSDE